MWHPTYALLRDGTPHAVVVSTDGDLHPEACQFLMGMATAGKALNTGKAYSRAVAKLLNWCEDQGKDWRQVTMLDLGRFRRWYESTPNRYGRAPAASSLAVGLVGVVQFLKFCASEKLIGSWVAEQLIQPRLLGSAVDRENPANNRLHARMRVRVPEQPIPALPFAVMDQLLALPMRPRTDFLVRLMWTTGCRIGEALSAWREDLHTLPNNFAANCPIDGPHFHVGRRYDQPTNRPKTGPRVVPIDDQTVHAHDRYLDWRHQQHLDGRHLFVVSQGDTRDHPLNYKAAWEIFEKFERRLGTPVRPHMLRHTRATWWVRHDVDLDVVRALLGHAQVTTTQKYLHATTEEMREAVDLLA